MQTLDDNALDTVTGGTPSATTSPITPSGGGNDQILSTLQNIQSSIKDLGNNNNQGLFSGANGAMLMMTMAFAMSSCTATFASVRANAASTRSIAATIARGVKSAAIAGVVNRSFMRRSPVREPRRCGAGGRAAS